MNRIKVVCTLALLTFCRCVDVVKVDNSNMPNLEHCKSLVVYSTVNFRSTRIVSTDGKHFVLLDMFEVTDALEKEGFKMVFENFLVQRKNYITHIKRFKK